MDRLNPYQFFFEHNNCRPFWAWKNWWATTRILVRHFDEPTGPAPYYGNPRAEFEVYEHSAEHSWMQVSPIKSLRPTWGTMNWQFQNYTPGRYPTR